MLWVGIKLNKQDETPNETPNETLRIRGFSRAYVEYLQPYNYVGRNMKLRGRVKIMTKDEAIAKDTLESSDYRKALNRDWEDQAKEAMEVSPEKTLEALEGLLARAKEGK
jgi:hypothetical protein